MFSRSKVVLLFLTSIFAASVSAQLVVTPSSLQGWQLTTSDGNALTLPPPSSFPAPGFETPPLGSGSLHLAVGPDGGDSAQARQPGFNLTRLDQLTALSYSTFTEVDGSGGQSPYLIINLDHNGDTTLDDQIFFEPVYQSAAFFPSNPQGPLVTDTWQTWNALTGGWWSVNNFCAAGPGANVKSLATYIACFPNARILNTGTGLGGLRIVTGFGAGAWDNFLGAADNFTIGVSGTNTTYDFEGDPLTTVTITPPSNLENWTLTTTDTNGGLFGASSTVVTGPGTPPIGTGSLQLAVGPDGDDSAEARSNRFDSLYLRDLTALDYQAYHQSGGSGGQMAYIILRVDYDNNGTQDDLLFFEPVYQTGAFCPSNPQPAVATGTWQTWEAANGCWWSLNGTAGATPGVGVKTLAQILDVEVDARLATSNVQGALRIVAGFGAGAWDNFIGNVDAFNVSFSTVAPPTNTLYDFDPLPIITIADLGLPEGNAGNTPFNFVVTLDKPVSYAVTVQYATADNTATVADLDYTAVPLTTITFLANDTSENALVNVAGDLKFEGDETFFVNLSNPSGATIGDNQATGTIQNDDLQPTIAFVADVAQAEGNAGTSNFIFTVNLSNPSSQTITVNFTTNPGTATEGVDYADNTGTLTFVPGDTSETITVVVNGDTTFEPNETFTVDLSAPTNATIADNQAVGTINNDDAQPTISFAADVAAPEGNAGPTNFVFTVNLSNPSSQTITVNYTTNPGTATEGTDYTDATGVLTFVPGDVSETITVVVTGDLFFEGDETFTVDLSAPTNSTITDNQALGTIQNDDGQPTIIIDDVTQVEGNAGTTNFVFTVTLSGPAGAPVTVNYTTNPGTATEGVDYADSTGMLTFVPGDTSETITVVVTGDLNFEPTETFFVDLSAPTVATLADNQGLGTIQNDEGTADVSITKTGPASTLRDQDVTYTITVTNNGPSTASNVVVTDVLPAGTTFVSATPTQGSCSGTTTVTCTLGAIANGGTATITLVVSPPQTGTFTNTATVTNTPEFDPTPNNNAGTVFTAIASSDIPTLSEWALMALIAALMGLAVVKLR